MVRLSIPEHYPRQDEQRLSMDLLSIANRYRRREINKRVTRQLGEDTLRKHYERITLRIERYLGTRGVNTRIDQQETLSQAIREWNNIVDDLSRL
jgi:hypothetical protein